ncbi:ricin b lectin [Fusarium albosuccineum]|uniref:Ricin b lectin n=1 Tax=Fusarium albosuccineum TaxID=1237068 RepID=A0A8H4PJ78_9HYPO|nr:ricin b lectin [Fusarium albosuccineum]
MRFSILTAALACASTASAAINWSLQKASNPTADQTDAYGRIEAAMRAAVARYGRFSDASKTIRVQYAPGVPTAEANFNGDLRFGSNRAYMNERTAMHEISHTLGIGQTAAFDRKCAANDWRTATPLLQSWDGAGVRINCGGGHIWPYGLNYDNEWSETNANRHVQLIDAMIADGLQG